MTCPCPQIAKKRQHDESHAMCVDSLTHQSRHFWKPKASQKSPWCKERCPKKKEMAQAHLLQELASWCAGVSATFATCLLHLVTLVLCTMRVFLLRTRPHWFRVEYQKPTYALNTSKEISSKRQGKALSIKFYKCAGHLDMLITFLFQFAATSQRLHRATLATQDHHIALRREMKGTSWKSLAPPPSHPNLTYIVSFHTGKLESHA